VKLERWRGWNVLLTDAVGLPILRLDESGNVVEAGGKPVSQYPLATSADTEGLARSVADWIAWVSDEPGEFRGCDIHPQLRERVIALQPGAVEP
jgi:hypothetical protein